MLFTRAFGALAARRNYIGRPEVEVDQTTITEETEEQRKEYADNDAVA